ncbi:MAG: hypothetical protein ACYDEV_13370 [Acidiferrobacter sp.]
MASESGNTRSSASSRLKRFWLYVSNTDYEMSPEPHKVYAGLRDSAAKAQGLVRIIDESGEDYLFPVSLFLPIALPHDTAAIIHRLVAAH